MGCSTACLALAVVAAAVVAKPVAVLPPLAAIMHVPIVVIRVAIRVAIPVATPNRAVVALPMGADGPAVDCSRPCSTADVVVATVVATVVASRRQPVANRSPVALRLVTSALAVTADVSLPVARHPAAAAEAFGAVVC